MLTLGIRYLNGCVVASHGRHEQVEWPPHPGRVFMALVAAHYETGAAPAEREALLWLESQPQPPDIHAPEACPRTTVTQYVPVNDDPAQYHRDPKTKKAKFYQEIPGTPFRRNRQDRTFARAWLAEDTAYLCWPQADPPQAIRSALQTISAKTTRIGHSSSLVQVWLADEPPAHLPRWVPDAARANCQMRVPVSGTLAALDEDFQQRHQRARDHRDESKSRSPVAGRRPLAEHGYARAEAAAPTPAICGTVFSPHLVVFTLERLEGPYRHLDLACTLALTERWREALASHANDLSAEAQQIISGHAPDRKPLEKPHLVFLPLGVVGHEHADGHLMGAALALPDAIPASLRQEVLRAAASVGELVLGRLGRWALEPVNMSRPPMTLRADIWTAHPAGATHWATVTPVAFDQHPKARNKAAYQTEAAELITGACERIGLPRPREVIITPVSAHLGAPPAHTFPRLRRKDGTERRHTQAILVFAEPVRGPVLLGAGRYRGYGFCRPMNP